MKVTTLFYGHFMACSLSKVVHHFDGFTPSWSSPLRRLRGSAAGGARPETLRTVCEINQTTIFYAHKLALLMHIIMQM